jgi:hypothetical protein
MGVRLALASLLLASGCSAPQIWLSHPELLDRDLNVRDPAALGEMHRSIRSLGFRMDEGFRGWLAYSTVLRNDQGELRWVFVWLEPAFKVPGYSRVRSGVVDSEGRILDDSVFLSGWRHWDFRGVTKLARSESPDVLLIRSEGMIIPNRWHYFALAGDHLEVVRLEAGEPKKLDSNYYRSPNHTIGPLQPPADEDECMRALEGRSWSRRMSLLTWLAGNHWDGTNAHLWHEDEKVAALGLRLQSSPRVRAALEALSRSPDAWTREAAAFALNPDR